MPTTITHALIAVCAAKAVAPANAPTRFCATAAICSMLPDADVLAFLVGIPYRHVLGHRGFSHSLSFAFLLAGAVALSLLRREDGFTRRDLFHWVFFFFITASHGVLDALTDGGLGIALLAPFDNQRYFLPWTPIEVSPIGIQGLFSRRGWLVMQSELFWVWLPSACLLLLSAMTRAARRKWRRFP